ncbi:hypothetical protein LCGC14_2359220, partial [marine sediment metagenome]
MRLSRYFLPVLKETPSEAQIASHRLMLRAGMIKQAGAGIYSWLPLGFKVLKKIEAIVHEEQQRAGHIPMLMPTLQSADLWRESGRYDAYGDEMLRIKDRQGRDLLYGPTNEEMITDIFRSHVSSYRDLPLTLYHVQWKFRDEIRPRFGVMRGREFLMKDGYNFDLTKEDALHAYNRHMVSYLRTYERMGLKAIPMRADSGPIGGEDTHEFLVLAETGESEVFYDAAITDLTLGERQVDYDDAAQCADIVTEWTTPYARTDETHDAGTFDAVLMEQINDDRNADLLQFYDPTFDTIYAPSSAGSVDSAIEEVLYFAFNMGATDQQMGRLRAILDDAAGLLRGDAWGAMFSRWDADPQNGAMNTLFSDSLANNMRDGHNSRFFIALDEAIIGGNFTLRFFTSYYSDAVPGVEDAVVTVALLPNSTIIDSYATANNIDAALQALIRTGVNWPGDPTANPNYGPVEVRAVFSYEIEERMDTPW